MLRRLLSSGLCFVVLWLTTTIYAQDPIPMPDVVLRAAQELNARYGQQIDVNNVKWYKGDYPTNTTYDPHALCENEDARLPPFKVTNKAFYIIEFQPYVNGLLSKDIWQYIAYDDMSYFGPCKTPPPPTATPVPYIPPTALPPTAYLSPTPVPTIGSCGGLVPRLAIGTEGRVTPGDPNNIRSDHGASTQFLGEIPAGGVFQVLDGPRCSVDGTWWQVNYNGILGWTLEGRDGVYFVEPASFAIATPTLAATQVAVVATLVPTFTSAPVLPTPTPTPIICNAAIPPRLRIGEQARVTAGGIPNNMREQQGRSSKYVGEIPPLGVFTVLEGPLCTGDGAWFKVDYNGIQGWTLEGMESDYWVEPTLPDLQPITLDNLSQLRMMPAVLGQVADPATTLRTLSNQGDLIGGSDPNFTRWTLADAFAGGDLLAWNAAPITIPAPHEPLIVNEQGWTFYDAGGTLVRTVAPVVNITPSHAAVSQDHRWGAVSQDDRAYSVALGDGSDVIQPLQDVHGENVLAIGFSQDGSTFVTLSATKIYAWDTATWQPRLILDDTPKLLAPIWETTAQIIVSPHGSHLLVIGESPRGKSLLATPITGDPQFRKPQPDGITLIETAAFVGDHLVIVSGQDIDQKGVLWAFTADSVEATSPIVIASNLPAPITSIVSSPNGTIIATFNSSEVRMWGVWGAPLDSHG